MLQEEVHVCMHILCLCVCVQNVAHRVCKHVMSCGVKGAAPWFLHTDNVHFCGVLQHPHHTAHSTHVPHPPSHTPLNTQHTHPKTQTPAHTYTHLNILLCLSASPCARGSRHRQQDAQLRSSSTLRMCVCVCVCRSKQTLKHQHSKRDGL